MDNDQQQNLLSIISKPYEAWTEQEREALIDGYLNGVKNQESERHMWRTLLKKPKRKWSQPEVAAFAIFTSILTGSKPTLGSKK